MAGEITLNAKIAVIKGSLVQRFDPGTLSLDMSGSTADGAVQSIPTTAAGTALDVSALTTAGWSYFCNTDATNYVDIGVQVGGTFYPLLKLKAGESTIARLGTNAPYARANTAAVNLQYFIFND
jgi:hypothetical protein